MNPSFDDYAAHLRALLDRRSSIVGNIERRLLNVRGKPLTRTRTRDTFETLLTGCVLDSTDAVRLHRMLSTAHLADGFEPVNREDYSQQLDPLDLVVRAYEHWDAHRWPGANGRLAVADALFSAFVIRQLEHLSLRVWDDVEEHAGARLDAVQRFLDVVNDGTATSFVRDARWLMQTAQGPLTRELRPYFIVAQRVASSFSRADALEIHIAGVKLAGGHLRSQLRYRAAEMRLTADDPSVLAAARNSNSMDVGLLVHDLVPVLEAYRVAADDGQRLFLADTIVQGLSADPELLLTRLDLLTPLTMIEDLFVDCASGHAQNSSLGRWHLDALTRYGELIAASASALRSDLCALAPDATAYSPLGIAYGFCADLFTNVAMDALVNGPARRLCIEDLFVTRREDEDARAQAQRWSRLPQRAGEREHFEYSAERAAATFARVMHALDGRVQHPSRANASGVSDARLFVNATAPDRGAVNAQEHFVTSDLALASNTGATAFPRSQILRDRKEGRFLASAEVDGRWCGVSKVVLTLCTAQGTDASMTGIPPSVVDLLRLTCPGLLG